MLKGDTRIYAAWPCLPLSGFWFDGPRWKRAFGVRLVPITALVPSEEVSWPWGGRRVWVYDVEPDVRELVCEPLQFDRVAMWADPRERL